MSIPIPPPLEPDLPAAIKIRTRGVVEYAAALDEMRAFTAARDRSAADEIWLLQHPPVFTLGASGRREHILGAGSIPIAQSDRGGQVTYHGPGQIVAYTLCDLRRRGRGARAFSRALQFAVVDFLAECGVAAFADPSRPGVLCARRKNRRRRLAHSKRRQLSRRQRQRADGFGSVRAHRPLRLSGAASHANRGSCRLRENRPARRRFGCLVGAAFGRAIGARVGVIHSFFGETLL